MTVKARVRVHEYPDGAWPSFMDHWPGQIRAARIRKANGLHSSNRT